MSAASWCVLLCAIIYVPFHLLEEAVGDFPAWMYTHHWLPYHMTHGHWMANNLFIYYPLALLCIGLYLSMPAFACCGIGVLVWGLVNFGDHAFYTLRDRRVSPGFITGFAFLANSIIGLREFASAGVLTPVNVALGVAIGAALFGIPIALCVATYPLFERLFNPRASQ